MSSIEQVSEERASVRNDLSAIFVSLELSLTTCVIHGAELGHADGGYSLAVWRGKTLARLSLWQFDLPEGGGMFGVDFYGRVRLAASGRGLSQREAARRFGIDRGTVSKMVSHSAPPGYRRTMEPRRPKLDRHIGFIDRILADDLSAPKKQRHTIQRIYDRL